ncbi:hypothetical protein BGX30_001144, partial [Mortierella sp. GBA39]
PWETLEPGRRRSVMPLPPVTSSSRPRPIRPRWTLSARRRAKILVESGSEEININQPITIMVENKEDIEKFVDFTTAAAGSAHTDIPVTNMRKVIAQRV